MDLQTKIPTSKQSGNLIDYNSKILLLGSCFSENIGNKFDYFKFQTYQNPFGILFHPKAIEKLVFDALEEKQFTDKDVFFHNGQWHSFLAHSLLNGSSKSEILEILNKRIRLTKKFIQESSHIIITLGTAWVYRHIETDCIVANCHKLPQNQFKKELLSIDSICQSLETTIALLSSIKSKTNIVFTVSPVRHLKDGFVENTLSKSHLISSIHKVILKNQKTFYFPSYEILMDELRDYRFYKEDMIHPSATAINYIWEKFKNVWVSDDANTILNEVETIQKGLSHKPFNPKSEAHQRFLKNLGFKIENLKARFPHIVF